VLIVKQARCQMNDIEKIDYIQGAIKGTQWAIEEGDWTAMPILELANSLELLQDLRQPYFEAIKKNIKMKNF